MEKEASNPSVASTPTRRNRQGASADGIKSNGRANGKAYKTMKTTTPTPTQTTSAASIPQAAVDMTNDTKPSPKQRTPRSSTKVAASMPSHSNDENRPIQTPTTSAFASLPTASSAASTTPRKNIATSATPTKLPPSSSSKSSTPSNTTPSGRPKQFHPEVSPLLPSYVTRATQGKHTYVTMIHEALINLADRNGSSLIRISKMMKSEHEHLNQTKPALFRSALNTAIKAGVKDKRFIKVKCSYKINQDWVKKEKAIIKSKEEKKARDKKMKEMKAKEKREKEARLKKEAKEKKEREARERREKEAREKREKEAKKMSPKGKKSPAKSPVNSSGKATSAATNGGILGWVVREKKDPEKEAREAAARAAERAEAQRRLELIRKKAEEAARAKKLLEERIRKRRFPMDDLALIAEDKELGVKKPDGLARSFHLPYAMYSVTPQDQRPKTKKVTPQSMINACTTVMTPGARGLVSDTLQVYHFFMGDVGYYRQQHESLNLTLKHLLYAIREVQNGNAKKNRIVPPIISHMFYTALKMLTSLDMEDFTGSDDLEKVKFEKLVGGLSKLGASLTEASWGEVLYWYVDTMERHYTTDASVNPNALVGDALWLDDESDDEMKDADSPDSKNDEGSDDDSESDLSLPDGYWGYIGPDDCVLQKAYTRLSKHDPWNLPADELMALLRALTDDMLALKPIVAEEISQRGERINELLQAKKKEEFKWRKVRLAHEGPKNIHQSKKKDANGNVIQPKPHVPTATKEELETATAARDKAVEAYETGLKEHTQRTISFGKDRSHSEFYFFRQDPDTIFVNKFLEKEPGSVESIQSWHIIDSQVMFDNFLLTLDDRGIRERQLLRELKTGEGKPIMKRFLHDENKKSNLIAARKRQEAEFKVRLENAKLACSVEDSSGRRSGRLKSTAKDALRKLEAEIEAAAAKFESDMQDEEETNYYDLTGIENLSEFESGNKFETKCSQLWNESNRRHHGIIGIIASQILSLESLCQKIDPLDNTKSREQWRDSILEAADEWQSGCAFQIGEVTTKKDEAHMVTPSKRQRRSMGLDEIDYTPQKPTVSATHILSILRNAVISVESRVFTMSGLQRAAREVEEAQESSGDSASDSDDETNAKRKAQYAWKKKILSLYGIDIKHTNAIREIFISCIKIARKAQLMDVLDDLRAVLKLYRPNAPGTAKKTALQLIEKYGGIEPGMDEDLDDVEEMSDDDSSSESEVESSLASDAMVFSGCLDGDEDASRDEWKDAVAECKTISRFAALVGSLVSISTRKIEKLTKGQKDLLEAIDYWKTTLRKRRAKKKKKVDPREEKYDNLADVWAATEETEDFVMVKVSGYPWWPARVCMAKDPYIAEALVDVDRSLISFVGEQHLHIVKNADEIRPFTGEMDKDEDLTEYKKHIAKNLKKSMSMVQHIMKGRGIKPAEVQQDDNFEDEKKSSS